MHPNEDALQAFLDRELEPEASATVRQHLSGCMGCRAAARRLRRRGALFAGAVRQLDAAEPAAWGPADEAAPAHAGANDPPAIPLDPAGARQGSPRPGRVAWFPPALRWAAGIVLVAAAGGSAAVLGLPGVWRPAGTDATPSVADPAAASAAAAAAAGVAVLPSAGVAEVHLAGAAAGSRLHVRLTDGPDVEVEVVGTAGAPRFQAREGTIHVELAGLPAMVTVRVPRSLAAGTIHVDGDAVVRTAGDRVTPAVAAEDGLVLPPAP